MCFVEFTLEQLHKTWTALVASSDLKKKYDLHPIIINSVCFNNARRGVCRTCSTINSLFVLDCWLDETILGYNGKSPAKPYSEVAPALYRQTNIRHIAGEFRYHIVDFLLKTWNQIPLWYFKDQLACRFDILDSISSFFCILTYAIIYVLIYHIIFWLYL